MSKPGRVYGSPGEAGVRDGTGCKVLTIKGVCIQKPIRVELDDDADEGLATVTACVCGQDGRPFPDYEANKPCQATFRTWVRVVPKGQPAPPPTPDAVLWEQPDGKLKWCEKDPLPDDVLASLNAASS